MHNHFYRLINPPYISLLCTNNLHMHLFYLISLLYFNIISQFFQQINVTFIIFFYIYIQKQKTMIVI